MAAPVRGLSLRLARPDDTGQWVTAGPVLGAVKFTPLIEDAAEDLVLRHGLDRSVTVSVAFRPSRHLLRLVLGPRWAWDRRRARQVTRRKQLARRGAR